jgi:FkbM family methyltransferase
LIELLAKTLRPLQFRGKERLANAVLPRTGERIAVICGAEFRLDMADHIQRNIYAGTYERLEAKLLQRILRSGMTFVDVGANVGFYTALAAEAVRPDGMVLAFEPAEYAFSRLRLMIERNGLTRVKALQCGLSDSQGQINLYGGMDPNNHTATMVAHDNPDFRCVPVETLDHIAAELNIRQIDVLKIDVDGFEPLVLRGARELMREGRISHILLECSEYWFGRLRTSSAEVFDYLQSSGFKKVCRVGKSDNYFFAYDGSSHAESALGRQPSE